MEENYKGIDIIPNGDFYPRTLLGDFWSALPDEPYSVMVDGEIVEVAEFNINSKRSKNLKPFKNYLFYAFPGPEVIKQGRVEHLPLHIHVKNLNNELRINCKTLEELDGKKIPKDLTKFLSSNKKEIEKRAHIIFLTGGF